MKKIILIFLCFGLTESLAAQSPSRVVAGRTFPLRVNNGHVVTGNDTIYCDWTLGVAFARGSAGIQEQPGNMREQKIMNAGRAAETDARNLLSSLFYRTYFNHNFVLYEFYMNFPYAYRGLTRLIAEARTVSDTIFDNTVSVTVSVPLYGSSATGLSVAALYCEVSNNISSSPTPGSGSPQRSPDKGGNQVAPGSKQSSEDNQDAPENEISPEARVADAASDKLLIAYLFPALFKSNGEILYNHSSICDEVNTSLKILPRNPETEKGLDPAVKPVRCYADEYGRYMVFPDDYSLVSAWSKTGPRYVFFKEFIMIFN